MRSTTHHVFSAPGGIRRAKLLRIGVTAVVCLLALLVCVGLRLTRFDALQNNRLPSTETRAQTSSAAIALQFDAHAPTLDALRDLLRLQHLHATFLVPTRPLQFDHALAGSAWMCVAMLVIFSLRFAAVSWLLWRRAVRKRRMAQRAAPTAGASVKAHEMSDRPASQGPARARAAFVALAALTAGPAAAHVKWFSRDADCAMPPMSPLQVLASPEFLLLGAISLMVMVGAALLDARLSRAGSPALAFADRLDGRCVAWLPHLLRLSLAAFFCIAVLYFGASPVFLTPELHAPSAWVPMVQLGIAVTLLWRPAAWVGALGIAVLYGSAAAAHGWFHLLDYPVFLAAAAFVAIDSLGRGRHNDLALAVLRVGTGITLMWAGAEKWLYPWWSDDVLNHELRAARGDFSSAFFMAAAGWVEFCAAYALVFGRLGTQVSAWVLLVPFLAAIPVFGVLDAIGHAPIIAVLIVLGLTRTRLPSAVQGAAGRASALRRGITCTFAGLASVGVYWGLQALAYPRLGGIEPGLPAVAVLLVVPLLLWWAPRLARWIAAAAHPSSMTNMASVPTAVIQHKTR